jgi:hypothetical protein
MAGTIDYLDYIPQSILNRETDSNFGKLWTIFSEQLDELLVQVAYAYTVFIIEDMTGKNLDQIGTLVQKARAGGEVDADYRISLLSAIAQNISGGSIPNIIDVCNLIKQGDTTKVVRLQETFPARFQLYTNMLELIGDTADVLNQSKAAGVAMSVTYSTSLYPFVFEGDISGRGVGDIAMDDGGEFSEIA